MPVIATPALSAPSLLTEIETAELIKIKPETLCNWRCTGRNPLPYIKVGRLVRYRLDDVLAWLEARTVAATDPHHV